MKCYLLLHHGQNNIPQINAQLSTHRLQVEMAAAMERDLEDLAKRLNMLARNDQLILNALRDGEQRSPRLEELVIAFTKVSLFNLDEISQMNSVL
jgi:hypothetical protein